MNYIRMKELRTFQQITPNTVINVDQHRLERPIPVNADSHIAYRSHAAPMPCRKGFRMCLSHLIYTVRPCLITLARPYQCHAPTMPFF